VQWAETLASFNFKIYHRKGSENGAADALSRQSDYMLGTKPVHDAVLAPGEDGTLQYNNPRLAVILHTENDWTKRIQCAAADCSETQELLE
jgi:hypothetical protein